MALLALFVLSAGESARRRFASVGPGATVKATGRAAMGSSPDARGESVQASALALSSDSRLLYLADEDHGVLRVVPLSAKGELTPRTQHREIALPGRPAAVVEIGGRVLVTVRQPGSLVALDRQHEEVARVALPNDAWGLAVADGLALVSSASTAQLSAIDLGTMKMRWTVSVAQEPRGIAIVGARAYVSHLAGAELTRIDRIAGEPVVSRVALPAAPTRTPPERQHAASLGYALALSPDRRLLFAPRRALGGLGFYVWAGVPAVDVLNVANDEPLVRSVPVANRTTVAAWRRVDVEDPARQTLRKREQEAFQQPRAVVYRERTNTLLVACEGEDALVELDALSLDPALDPLRRYRFVNPREAWTGSTKCGAPSAVALSADEARAYVYCRSTDGIASVDLAEPMQVTTVRVADDNLSQLASRGRRFFYDANDRELSDGIGCAGCHPDGRNDGHVWLEPSAMDHGYLAFPFARYGTFRDLRGEPRQTPTLAGRIAGDGPFGWRGTDETLDQRIVSGFVNHRWFVDRDHGDYRNNPAPGDGPQSRADALAAFVRQGLVPPPRPAVEPRLVATGKRVFVDADVGCATCHPPERGWTDSMTHAIFSNQRIRTPPLTAISGSAPFFHDGSAATLEEVIDHNRDRMGRTSHLTADERTALLAFLRTL